MVDDYLNEPITIYQVNKVVYLHPLQVCHQYQKIYNAFLCPPFFAILTLRILKCTQFTN